MLLHRLSFIFNSSHLVFVLLILCALNSQAALLKPKLQTGHSEPILAIDTTHDGKFAVTGGTGRALKIWELKTRREVRTLPQHPGIITDLEITPDDQYVLSSVKQENKIYLWDLSDGKLVKTLPTSSPPGDIEVSRNQKYILSSSGELIEIDSGRKVQTFNTENHVDLDRGQSVRSLDAADAITSVSISPDSSTAAVGLINGEIHLFLIKNGKKYGFFKHRKSITALQFSPDGTELLSGSYDGSAALWDIQQRKIIHHWEERFPNKEHVSEVLDVIFSHDGKHCVIAERNKRVTIRNRKSGKITASIHTEHIVDKVAWQRDPDYVLTVSREVAFEQWHPITGNFVNSFQINSSDEKALVVNSEGTQAFTISNLNRVTTWNLLDGSVVSTWDTGDHYISRLTLSKNNQWLAAGSDSHDVLLWNLNNGGRNTFSGHSAAIASLGFAQNDRYLVSSAQDGEVISWDINTGNIVDRQASGDPILALEVAPNEETFATGGFNGSARVWNVSTDGRLKSRIVFKHKEGVMTLGFSPDSNILYTGALRKLRSFDLKNNALIKPSIDIDTPLHTFDISPNGRHIAIGYALSTIYEEASSASSLAIWDTKTKKRTLVPDNYQTTVSGVHFDPISSRLLVAIAGGIDIYDYHSNELIATLTASRDGESTVVTPDGYYNGSIEGSDLIYLVNQQTNKSYDLFQYESQLKKPAIIQARLRGDLDAGTTEPLLNEPPELSLIKPVLHFENTSAISVNVSSTTKVKDVKVFIDGVPFDRYPVNEFSRRLDISIPFRKRPSRIALYAFDEHLTASNPLYVDAPPLKEQSRSGILHILAIGIDNYTHLTKSWDLAFAASDAKSFSKAFKRFVGESFSKVNVDLLLNEDATRENIIDRLKKIVSLSENDMAVVFIAGHGVQHTKSGKFFLLTHDTEDAYEPDSSQAIDWETIGDTLAASSAKILTFLDACHSASITRESVLANDQLATSMFSSNRSGHLLFAASKGRQSSEESSEYGGGRFTQTLIRAISTDSTIADYNQNGFVEYMEMVDFVRTSVQKASEGQQTPWLARREMFGDFPIANVLK